eukprot:4123883-Pleurochrysis_carterae.AAC.3
MEKKERFRARARARHINLFGFTEVYGKEGAKYEKGREVYTYASGQKGQAQARNEENEHESLGNREDGTRANKSRAGSKGGER